MPRAIKIITLSAVAALAAALPAQSNGLVPTGPGQAGGGTSNPLAAKPGTTPSATGHGSASRVPDTAPVPASPVTTTFIREMTARVNQYDVVRMPLQGSDGGKQARATYDLAWLGMPKAASQGSSEQPVNQSGERRTGDPNSLARFELRFPSVAVLLQRDGGPGRPLNTAAEQAVASARLPYSSVRVGERNLSAIEREVRALQQRIDRRNRFASEDALNRRLERITRRYDRKVEARVAELRQAGRLERLAVDRRGHLVNAWTREAAGASDLPRADRRRLAAERDRARKQVHDAVRDARKFASKLAKQKAKLQAKQAKQARKAPKRGK